MRGGGPRPLTLFPGGAILPPGTTARGTEDFYDNAFEPFDQVSRMDRHPDGFSAALRVLRGATVECGGRRWKPALRDRSRDRRRRGGRVSSPGRRAPRRLRSPGERRAVLPFRLRGRGRGPRVPARPHRRVLDGHHDLPVGLRRRQRQSHRADARRLRGAVHPRPGFFPGIVGQHRRRPGRRHHAKQRRGGLSGGDAGGILHRTERRYRGRPRLGGAPARLRRRRRFLAPRRRHPRRVVHLRGDRTGLRRPKAPRAQFQPGEKRTRPLDQESARRRRPNRRIRPEPNSHAAAGIGT